jgi:hypothetical protein
LTFSSPNEVMNNKYNNRKQVYSCCLQGHF